MSAFSTYDSWKAYDEAGELAEARNNWIENDDELSALSRMLDRAIGRRDKIAAALKAEIVPEKRARLATMSTWLEGIVRQKERGLDSAIDDLVDEMRCR